MMGVGGVMDLAMRAVDLSDSLMQRPKIVLPRVHKTRDDDADYFGVPFRVRPVRIEGEANYIASDLDGQKPGNERILDGEGLENTQHRGWACDCHGLFSYLLGALPENADRTIRPTLAFAQASILTKLRQRDFVNVPFQSEAAA